MTDGYVPTRRCARRITCATVFGALVLTLVLGSAAFAQSGSFYEGKTVTLAVGFTPGGGNDAYARLLARHYTNHLPGKPTVIVQNMPGAASSKPVMHLDAGAPKDGTVIASFGPDIIPLSLFEPDKMKIDFSKLAWVGSITRDQRVCFAWGASRFKGWNDLFDKAKKYNVGASSQGSNAYSSASILKNMFGANANIIMGYPGSAEQRIAIERGELDGGCGSWTSVPADWVRDKKIVPLVRFSATPTPDMPAMPYIGDLAKSERDKQLLNLLLAAAEVGRPYVASLSIPADRLATLRKGFDATVADPAFLAESDKMGGPISPVSGAAAAKLIDAIYAASPELIAAAREIVK